MFKALFLLIFIPLLLVFVLGGVTIIKFMRRIQDVKRQFMGETQSRQQAGRGTRQRPYRPNGDSQVYDSRSDAERNRKIIPNDEGDYVPYEEVR